MKLNIIHSIVVCLTAFTLPFIVACSSQDESYPDTSEATLYLDIATMEQGRSGLTALPENELMKSVRVVVLHADGSIEHNRHYSLSDPQEKKYVFLKVKPAENKKIYLFSNEESVASVEGSVSGNQTLTAFFNGYAEGMTGFAEAVDNLYFAPDYSEGKPIPMSSVYEIEVPENENVEKKFYVVRVATKFVVNFMNWRGEEVTVEKFTLASYADKNFLMAHVEDTERNRELLAGKTWIDWLKEVSDASSVDDDYAKTEAAGWLKDYQLPAQADKAIIYSHGVVELGLPKYDSNNPENSKPGVARTLPVFYLPESMNLKGGTGDKEQEYTLTVHIKGKEDPFVCTLPNLKALFRNTNVVVDISLHKVNEISVDVIPYSEITLDPEFGLLKDKQNQ